MAKEEERKISPAVIIIPVALGLGALGVVAAIALAGKPKPPIPPPPPPGKANLYGQVTDAATGAIIADVLVTVDTASTYTDSSGAYTLLDLAPGSYTATFSATGYEPLSLSVALVEGNNELNIQMTPTGVPPPPPEPDLISLFLPSVPSGSEFYPEYTLFLPKPWDTVENPIYHFRLWIEHPTRKQYDPIYHRNVPLKSNMVLIYIFPYEALCRLMLEGGWLKNPDGVYTFRGTDRGTYRTAADHAVWGPSLAAWEDDTLIEPRTYSVKGSLWVADCISISWEGYEFGAPTKTYNLGVVGTLTVTQPLLPYPEIKARITGFWIAPIGAWAPVPLTNGMTVQLRTDTQGYETNYLGISYHNDTIVEGTLAEVDPKLANGPFIIKVTMDGLPWYESEEFYWPPCVAWNRSAVFGEYWASLPPPGYHTVSASILCKGKVLHTYSVSFTTVA